METFPKSLENVVDRLAQVAVEHGCEASASTLDQLAQHAALIQRWNRRKRIVGSRDPEDLLEVHLADGLALAGRMQSWVSEGQTFLDVGSGAGLPGLAVALLLPTLQTHLCEVSEKRVAFLHHARSVLKVSVTILHEDVHRLIEQGARFDHVVSRAVFEPKQWFDLGRSCVKCGGHLWCMLTARQHGEILTPAGAQVHRYAVAGDRERVLYRICC